MIKEGGQEGDGNWNFDSLRNRYTYLCNTWGNLLSRALTPRLGGTGARLKGVTDDNETVELSPEQYEEERKLRNAIDSAVEVYKYMMRHLNFEAALSVIDNLFRIVPPFPAASPHVFELTIGKCLYDECEAMVI